MRCPACRSRVSRRDTFCGVCGTPFGAGREVVAPQQGAGFPAADFASQAPQALPPMPYPGAFPPPPPPADAASPFGAFQDAGDLPMPAVPPSDARPLDGRTCTYCGASIAPNDIFCGSCGNVNTAIVAPGSASVAPAVPLASPPPPPPMTYVEPLASDSFPPVAAQHGQPMAVPSSGSHTDVGGEGEETIVVQRRKPVVAFTIEFSTGQTELVSAKTLMGRNPRISVGESNVDRIVLIDVTRSVSKTHGEFSIVDGVLYYRDRTSANGSELLVGGVPTLLEPEQWVELVPGSEVLIGDQKFTVL